MRIEFELVGFGVLLLIYSLLFLVIIAWAVLIVLSISYPPWFAWDNFTVYTVKNTYTYRALPKFAGIDTKYEANKLKW